MSLLTVSEREEIIPILQSLTVSRTPDQVFSGIQGLPPVPKIKPPTKWQKWLDSLSLDPLLDVLDLLGPVPSVERILSRLKASIKPQDEWFLMEGVFPVINRVDLCKYLAELEQGIARIVVVHGQRHTGGTFTNKLISAYFNGKPGISLVHLDLLGAGRVDAVARSLAMRLEAGELPAMGDSAVDFWVRELAEFLLISIDKKPQYQVWLIIDHLERARPNSEVSLLIQHLARGVYERRPHPAGPRLVLIDQPPETLPYDCRTVTRQEGLKFLGEVEVFHCASQIVEGGSSDFSAIAKDVVVGLGDDELKHREMHTRFRRLLGVDS